MLKLKKVISVLSAVASLGLLITSCNFESLDSDSKVSTGYGSLTVGSSVKAIETSDFAYFYGTVTGTGITNAIEAEGSLSSASGKVTFTGIPIGKNRIVTIYARNSSKQNIQGLVLRGVCDINEGNNTLDTITWKTTSLGDVFAKLLACGVDLSTVIRSSIENVIDSSKVSSLIDTYSIASDYMNGSLKSSSSYLLEAGSVSFNCYDYDNFSVVIGDPLSSKMTNCPSGKVTVTNVAPGTWQMYIISDGAIKHRSIVTVKSGKETTAIDIGSRVITDRIIMHAYGYKYIWLWDDGMAGSLTELTQEGSSSWYSTTINKTYTNYILRTNGGNDWNGKTGDLKIEAAGEYWYKDNTLYTSNPEDSVSPSISNVEVTSGTLSDTFTVNVSCEDNTNLKSIYVLIDNELASQATVSGTSCTATISVDSTDFSNGKHTLGVQVEDACGNMSEAYTTSITISNSNKAPTAVISGSTRGKPNAEITLSASNSKDKGGSVVAYSWTASGCTIVSGKDSVNLKVKLPSSETTCSVTLKVQDNEGLWSSEVSQTITVKEQLVTSGDFRDESIYFLMTTRFYDGDKSNNEYCWDEGGDYMKISDGDCGWRGDFKGLAQKLDYIKALGFSSIWITPVVENASGLDYHGYHAFDFSKVDPRYESDGFTYQDLIDECHARGIKVIQDIVVNHTGNFGERNLFKMFEKEYGTPYINKDVATPAGGKRSAFVSIAKDGNAYDALMKGLKQAGSTDYDTALGGVQYAARINAMKEDSLDTNKIYHHTKSLSWNGYECQTGQIAGDCVDLNTENPIVYNYLIDCYNKYIEMGVDAFRVDTVKHVNRLTFNETFLPAWKEKGGDDFYVFGECCARYRGRFNEGVPSLSPAFYTWKETGSYSWGDEATNSASTAKHFTDYAGSFTPSHKGTPNHLLSGNEYHKPDWSLRSGLDQIDFPMHWAFNSAGDAFNTAVGTNDPDFNDATWNVTYVDSHDYAPDNAPESARFNGTWPDKLNLIFTFRGIPCIYYGSEIEFQKGMPIDPANTRTSLAASGRAYYGDYLEGNVEASDYGVYTASGAVASTLNHDLAQHVIRLNQIRRSISALRKGQYSTKGCSGSIAFKRRYTDNNVDSFALVAINGQATFSGVPSGEYIEVITGKTVSCDGTLTTDSIGSDNMRVYVLKTSTCEVSGKIGKDGAYLK